MTALQNNPLSTPLMSFSGIHNYIKMVKVYAINAERMNDELVRHCLELNLEQLDALVKEELMGVGGRYRFDKLSNHQANRYCKIVTRIAKLLTATTAHKL